MGVRRLELAVFFVAGLGTGWTVFADKPHWFVDRGGLVLLVAYAAAIALAIWLDEARRDEARSAGPERHR